MIKLRWHKMDEDMISAYGGYGFTYDLETKTFDIVKISTMLLLHKNLNYDTFAGFIHLLTRCE